MTRAQQMRRIKVDTKPKQAANAEIKEAQDSRQSSGTAGSRRERRLAVCVLPPECEEAQSR